MKFEMHHFPNKLKEKVKSNFIKNLTFLILHKLVSDVNHFKKIMN